jgi:glycosyltransferase involved in cell wall biosynthesis
MTATILHLTGDFPDSIVASKTPVIADLLSLTADRFDHVVYSLNRRAPSPSAFAQRLLRDPFAPALPVHALAPTNRVTALLYDAPGCGLYHRAMLERLADWIGDDVVRSGLRPDIVHGHKLGIEGIVAARVARRLEIPYTLSIQGNTDRRIVSARPDLHRLFARLYHDAAMVFPFAPWAAAFLDTRLGPRRNATILLPCPTTADRIIAPRVVGPRLMTAFHLAHYRNKNVAALIHAARRIEKDTPGFALDLYGGGPEHAVAALNATIRSSGASSVNLAGPIAHADIQATMNAAAGFALVSRRESFGLVFIEALLAGCPIVYPAGAAISGYVDDLPFAIPARAASQDEITDAMRRLVRDEASIKSALATWQADGRAAAFQRGTIAATYSDGMGSVIGESRTTVRRRA